MLSTEDVKSLSVRQLRAELTTRGLDSAGRKSVLHDRLSAAITAEESAEEGREREELSPTTVTDDQLAATNPARELDYHDLRTTIVSVMTETLQLLLEAARAPAPSASAQQPPVPAASCHAIVPLACEPTRMLAASTPPRLAERIRSGEFVDLSDLLPQVSGGYAGSTHSDTTMHFEMLNGGPLRLVPDGTRSRNRHVCDLATWSEAFVMYMHTILQTAPHRALELLSYQGLIIEANRRFTCEGWLDYDRQFRQAAASNPGMRWDNIDANIWQLTTSNRARPACSDCGMNHQPFPAGRCLFCRSSQTAAPSTASSTNTYKGRPICRNFQSSRCQRSNCGRAHVCFTCQGSHPANKCTAGPAKSPNSASSR